MHEDERAPLYLIKLHQELEELGRYPRSAIPAAILLTLGVVYSGTGLLEIFRSGGWGSVVWLFPGAGVGYVGFLLARHSYNWYRRVKSLKRGIHLIESRQVAVQARMREGSAFRDSGAD